MTASEALWPSGDATVRRTLHLLHVVHRVHHVYMVELDARPRSLTALLVFMCAALALVIKAGSSLSLALPDVAADTGATQTETTWVVNAYALVFAALLLPVGIAADKFGRRPALLIGLVIFGAASVASGLVDDPTLLIVLRGVAGIGAAAVMPATLSVLVDAYPPERRSRAISIWAGVSGAGALVGVVLAGLLLNWFWWGSIQLTYGIAALLIVVACALVVAPSRNPALSLDPAGAITSLFGLLGLVYAVIEGPERGWTDPLTLAAGGVGLLGLAGFILVELRVREPMLDVRLFRSPLLSAGAALVFLQFFAAFVFFLLAPQWLQYTHGLDALEASLALIPLAAGIAPASALGPVILNRFGPGAAGATGMTLMAAAFASFALQSQGDQSLWFFCLTLIGFGFGFGLAVTPGTTLIIDGLPADRRTLSAAVNDVTREVGGALGGAVGASVALAIYADKVRDGIPAGTPPAVAEVVEDGMGQALGVASELPEPTGGLVMRAATNAFGSGFAGGLWVSAAVLLLGAVVAFVGARKASPGRGPANATAPGDEPEGAATMSATPAVAHEAATPVNSRSGHTSKGVAPSTPAGHLDLHTKKGNA